MWTDGFWMCPKCKNVIKSLGICAVCAAVFAAQVIPNDKMPEATFQGGHLDHATERLSEAPPGMRIMQIASPSASGTSTATQWFPMIVNVGPTPPT